MTWESKVKVIRKYLEFYPCSYFALGPPLTNPVWSESLLSGKMSGLILFQSV